MEALENYLLETNNEELPAGVFREWLAEWARDNRRRQHGLLLRCYRDNRNPQAVLPILSRAMGHVSLASTAYYLSLIDPILEQAAQHVARHVGPRLAGNSGGSHG